MSGAAAFWLTELVLSLCLTAVGAVRRRDGYETLAPLGLMFCIPSLMFFLNHRVNDWTLVSAAAAAFAGTAFWCVRAVRAIRARGPNQDRGLPMGIVQRQGVLYGQSESTVLRRLFLAMLLGDIAVAVVGYYLLRSLIPVVVVFGLTGVTAILFVWKPMKTRR
jgi:hypothetical protein